MSEHTPGPWAARDDGITATIAGKDKTIISVTWANGQQSANARLIVSAPGMRAAIEQALDDMGEGGHCVCEETKQMLRDAIAKAEFVASASEPAGGSSVRLAPPSSKGTRE